MASRTRKFPLVLLVAATAINHVACFSVPVTHPSTIRTAFSVKIPNRKEKFVSSPLNSHLNIHPSTRLRSSGENNEKEDNTNFVLQSTTVVPDAQTTASGDALFDGRTTVSLIVSQCALIALAAGAASLVGTPNYGLGPNFNFDTSAFVSGAVYTIPLFVLAFVLDFVEKYVPELQDVTKATQRSVIALLGGTRKPFLALLVSTALGVVAGLGEEMLFRGVLQTELSTRFGSTVALGASSLIFGALHAVTPLYALLASVASVFFGVLYINSHNLAVPIVCHGLYDIGALLWAHYVVTGMTDEEKVDLLNWTPK